MITRSQNKVTCPNCGQAEEIPIETFDKMLEIPWVNYLRGQLMHFPLKCPHCGHGFWEKFYFPVEE